MCLINSILWQLAPLVNASRLSLSLLINHASDLRPDKSARKEAYTPARIEARPVEEDHGRAANAYAIGGSGWPTLCGFCKGRALLNLRDRN